MINTAMFARKNELNDFTAQLAVRCAHRTTPVKLRNGKIIEIVYQEAKQGDQSVFHTESWTYIWNLDGSSVTTSEFDIVEF